MSSNQRLNLTESLTISSPNAITEPSSMVSIIFMIMSSSTIIIQICKNMDQLENKLMTKLAIDQTILCLPKFLSHRNEYIV